MRIQIQWSAVMKNGWRISIKSGEEMISSGSKGLTSTQGYIPDNLILENI